MQPKFYLEPKIRILNKFMQSQHMKSVFYALTLPVLELKQWIEKEIEENPLVEKEDLLPIGKEKCFSEKSENIDLSDNPIENIPWSSSNLHERRRAITKEENEHPIFDNLPKKESLFDHLLFQASIVFKSKTDIKIAEQIIGSLNSKGFLDISLQEIADYLKIEVTKIEKTLEIVQSFHPPGIAARNLEESFLIQLKHQNKEDSVAYRIVKFHYNDFIHNKFAALSKKLNLSLESLQKIINKDLKKLVIIPSLKFSDELSQPIIPDVIIKHEQNRWIISINDQDIPKICIQNKYDSILHSLDKNERQYLQKYMLQGKWLIRAINSRNTTLTKVVYSIVKIQRHYLLGISPLIPMNYKDLSAELKLHISTISRAVSNKYVACPIGLVALRSFFSSSPSKSTSNKNTSTDTALKLLKNLIIDEDRKHPLSDAKLAKKIDELGIFLARRTVAKYRKKLKIASAKQRKLF
jgi:RNA polymerase sigma-54 factor